MKNEIIECIKQMELSISKIEEEISTEYYLLEVEKNTPEKYNNRIGKIDALEKCKRLYLIDLKLLKSVINKK